MFQLLFLSCGIYCDIAQDRECSYLCVMEIRNDKKVIATGKSICLTAGILAAVSGFYWLVKALTEENTNLPALLSSFACALFLILYSIRK